MPSHAGDETPPAATCRSCGAELQGSWCHACGQGHRHVRLSLRALAAEVLDALISADTRFLRTLRMLTRDPGRVCREYLSGRRVPWTHPVKYALFTATLAFLVQRWLFALERPPGSELELRAQDFQVEFGLLMNFLFLPIWAGLTCSLFFRSGLRWVEHFVVACYGFGQLFFLQMCMMPLTRLGGAAATVFEVVAVLLPVPYLSWLAVTVWGSRWWSALLLIALAWVLSQVLIGGLVAMLFLR